MWLPISLPRPLPLAPYPDVEVVTAAKRLLPVLLPPSKVLSEPGLSCWFLAGYYGVEHLLVHQSSCARFL
ncbi:hypothetical protein AYI69_g2153 [Smittium culicis]|uniref:Uncharacterized protein n=1 Tax=Smittium culicis TaxID=133412 RepID=A0A1R1YNR4_9FUNG|nr:hypothetical protein AYI69_g2153 [Smittium culicis]